MRTLIEYGLANALLATVFAVVAVLLRPFCRRPALLHFLWLIVLLKLLTPPLVSIPFAVPIAFESVRELFPSPRGAGPNSLVVHQPPFPTAGGGLATISANPMIEIASDSLAAADLDGGFEDDAPSKTAALLEVQSAPHSGQSETAPGWNAGGSLDPAWWWAAVGIVWMAGTVGLMAVAAIRIARFHRLLRSGEPAPAELQEQARLLANRLGLARCPAVWLIPGRISPLLWPLGRNARLVLPTVLLRALTADQRATLLAHELAHARRRDHWVRWLELAATALYWWLPVVWWVRRQLRQAEEQCCDAWVVWTLPAAAKAYAKALLQTVEFLDARPALPPVASGVGHLYLLKRRLTVILRKPSCPQTPWPLRLGALVLGLAVLPAAPHHLIAQREEDESALPVLESGPVIVAVADDESGDVKKRLQKLEDKMERLLKALEGRRDPQGPTGDQGRRAEANKREAEEKARAAQKQVQEWKRVAEQRARERQRQSEERKQEEKREAESRSRELLQKKREAEERSRELQEKAESKEKKTPSELPKRALDANLAKDLERRIHELVTREINPERMKELNRQIQEVVSTAVNSKQLKDLDRRVQELINRSINPQRVEAIAKQIEADVKRRVQTVQKLQLKVEATRPVVKPAAKPVVAPVPAAPPGAAPRPSAQTSSDVNRRLDRLEERVDKLIRALDKSSKD